MADLNLYDVFFLHSYSKDVSVVLIFVASLSEFFLIKNSAVNEFSLFKKINGYESDGSKF